MRRSKSRQKADVNRLDPRVGSAFVEDLRQLVGTLSQESFKSDYLNRELFSKYLDPKLVRPATRRRAAIDKWLKAETQNRLTNMRLLFLEEHDFGWTTGAELKSKVRGIIKRTLGVCPFDVLERASHTNGASTRVPRSPIAAILKLSEGAHCSSSALQHWSSFLYLYGDNAGTVRRLRDQTVTLQESSVLFTVEKKSEIDRVACKEPEVNMCLQRSVGLYIRRCLRRIGIDLNDQTRNQGLAAVAYQRGLATVDLSSASDTISHQLVVEMLPADWYFLLNDLRVKSTEIDGTLHELEMFSSMGNGFTFELESLLFYAITRAVMELSGKSGRPSVYGDDIIVDQTIVPRLRRTFHFLGFTMNPKKTHGKGSNFRESCGKHYWKGFDVTPFYVRRAVRTKTELILHLNHLLEWDGRGWGFFLTQEVAQLWAKYTKFIPKSLWGGFDITSPYALVTRDGPRKRLAPIVRESAVDEDLALDHWLWSKCATPEPLEVDPSMVVGYRLLPNPSLGQRSSWDPLLIYEEGLSMTVLAPGERSPGWEAPKG